MPRIRMTITMIYGAQPLYKGAEYTMGHVESEQLIRAGVAIPVATNTPATAERTVAKPAEESRQASTQKKISKK
jgi:hypothetical protein